MSEQQDAMTALSPDMPKKKAYCGIDKIFLLPADHPFNAACQWHDQQYRLAAIGLVKGESSASVDEEFYKQISEIAGDDLVLQGEALLFYGLVRAWGIHKWPEQARR